MKCRCTTVPVLERWSKTRNRISHDGWDVGVCCSVHRKSVNPAARYCTTKAEHHVNQKGYSFSPNQRGCSWSQGFQTHLPHKRWIFFFYSSQYVFNKKPQQLHSQIRLCFFDSSKALRRMNSCVWDYKCLLKAATMPFIKHWKIT